MTDQSDATPTQLQLRAPRVHLIQPRAGATIVAGGLISGVGWVEFCALVSAVHIHLGPEPLGQAKLGLAGPDLAQLIGSEPPDGAKGFVFGVTVPILPPGPLALRLQAETSEGRVSHDVNLILAAGRKPIVPDPVRAMIETASINERGVLRVVGWAVSLSPINKLQVFLGKRLLGEAEYGARRDDVAATLTEYPNGAKSGFLFQQKVSETELTETVIRVIVILRDGMARAFTALLEPPERIQPDAPERFAKVDIETMRVTLDGRVAIKGWAVAAAGVADIRVDLDDEPVVTTKPTENRADVAQAFPQIPSAARSGYRLQARRAPISAGNHLMRVTVRGRDGAEHAVQRMVAVGAAAGAEDAQAESSARIHHHLDAPICRDGQAVAPVRGFFSLNGWAFSPDGIDRIEVLVDGASQGYAHYGTRREDLRDAFPAHDTSRCGFAVVLPPQVVPPGQHTIRIIIRDKAGRFEEINFSVQAEADIGTPGPWTIRTKLPQSEIDLLHAILASRRYAPQWTILLVLGASSDISSTRDTIESLRWQAYDGWSAIIAAEPTVATPLIEAILDAFSDLRSRIRLEQKPEGSPLAAFTAPDGWLCVLAPGDRLGEDALLEMSVASALEPGADFFYSDERRIDPTDGQEKAFFKPDFSPDLLLSTNYIGRLWAANAALLARTGLLLSDLLAHGHYDAVLRLTEASTMIRHVNKVLCARGHHTDTRTRERLALSRAMRRRSITGSLQPGAVHGTWRVQRQISATGRAQGLVSILIPTIATDGRIRTAIESIRLHTAWPFYEIICLDNMPYAASPEQPSPEQQRWRTWIKANADRTIALPPRPNAPAFNWSRLNNRGARQASGAFLLFLNDDIEVRDSLWLHGLIEQAQRPEVGVVGPCLLYPDGRVQHAGMFLARHAARHAFRFFPADAPGPFGLALMQREVISVTGAAMMMRRDVFDRLGGFNEAHPIINNDLDFNLRARREGLSVLYTPAVSLIHHEQVSRAGLTDAHDARRFRRDWGEIFDQGDPYFSRHLSRDHDDYQPQAEPVKTFTAGHPLFGRDAIRRILVVKVDHIGDFVTAFPALQRLRAAFPAAELTVLAADASAQLAALEPAIDRVIAFNFFHARSDKGQRPGTDKALVALRARLSLERFDLAIDLRRQADTRTLLQATGARWLAGFQENYAHPWLDIAVPFEGDVALQRKSMHVADSLLGLVEAIISQCAPDRRVLLASASRAAPASALMRLPDGTERDGGRIVCIHPGAGAVNKQWPAASFAALIDLLAGMASTRILLIGGMDDAAIARDIQRRLRHTTAVRDLVGRYALSDLAEWLRAADLFVGNDSGPKHLAAALGVPTIGIHPGTVDASEWGALGPLAVTIRRDVTCSPCYLMHIEDCPRALACLDGISVGDVFEQCRRMLGLAGSAGDIDKRAQRSRRPQ